MSLPDAWGDLTIDDLSIGLDSARGERPKGPAGTDLKPFLAEFVDDDLEKAHRADYFEHQLAPNGLRVYLLLLGTFAPFAVVDALVVPSILDQVLMVRFGIVFPIWILMAWRISRNYTPAVGLVSALVVVASFMGFFGWIAWVAPAPGSQFYFSYIAIVVFGGPVIARWTVRLSLQVGSVSMAYVTIFTLLHPTWDMPSRVYLFVLFMTVVIFGVYGAYTIQTGARRVFLQHRISG